MRVNKRPAPSGAPTCPGSLLLTDSVRAISTSQPAKGVAPRGDPGAQGACDGSWPPGTREHPRRSPGPRRRPGRALPPMGPCDRWCSLLLLPAGGCVAPATAGRVAGRARPVAAGATATALASALAHRRARRKVAAARPLWRLGEASAARLCGRPPHRGPAPQPRPAPAPSCSHLPCQGAGVICRSRRSACGHVGNPEGFPRAVGNP